MSDTIKKWHEMQEEGWWTRNPSKAKETIIANKTAKYIFLLDFNDGKVYRYNISVLCTDENKWNPDTESCEAFLYGAGHKLSSCEWMVTSNQGIEFGN